ncbi:MAG: 4Fe-4S binding protein [Nitrososphaerales archaeon]
MPNMEDMPIGFVISKAGSTCKIKTASWRTFKPIIDYNKCTDCSWCWVYCPEPAIEVRTDFKKGKYVINYDYCKGCGICAEECPIKAITMVKEEI